MNIIEAAKLMKQGCKVRLEHWCGNEYLHNHLDMIRDERDEEHELSLCDLLDQGWEIYKKEIRLYTFEQALIALKDGKSIKRRLWTMLSIEKEINKNLYNEYSIIFTIDDFEANDWIILDN